MYTAALIVHIAGVLLLIGAVGTAVVATLRAQTAATVAALRRATIRKTRAGAAIGPVLLLVVVAGLYLASRHGDDGSIRWTDGWLDVAIIVVVLMAALGPTVEARHARRLLALAAGAPDGPVPPRLDGIRRAVVPSHVSLFGAGEIVALLYLMIAKPGLLVAVLACVVAGAIGVGVSAARLHQVRQVSPDPTARVGSLSS